MAKVYYPPEPTDIASTTPVIFTAGPIQGAPRWQESAIDKFQWAFYDSDVAVACPRTPGEWHYRYNEQVDWELEHLQRAAGFGVVMFWLANRDPSEHHPPGRCYAQTSRFELGEWVGRFLSGEGRSLVIGIEDGFPNERYIRRRCMHAFPKMMIHGTLESTCDAVVAQVMADLST